MGFSILGAKAIWPFWIRSVRHRGVGEIQGASPYGVVGMLLRHPYPTDVSHV